MTSFSASWLHLFWLVTACRSDSNSLIWPCICRHQSVRSLAEWPPMLIDCTSVSISHHLIFLLLSHTDTHTRLTALCLGLPGWAGTRNLKSIWILLKQETMSGSQLVYMQVCTLLQTTTPAPHRSCFYRPDALPAAQPTASKHSFHYIHVSFMLRIALTTVRCSTLCLRKKQDTKLLPITSRNVNRFSKFFHS